VRCAKKLLGFSIIRYIQLKACVIQVIDVIGFLAVFISAVGRVSVFVLIVGAFLLGFYK
jgi:hypothetical protein